MPATAQSLGLSMFGNTVLMCWFASTLRASLRTLHTADASPSFRDYALWPKRDSSANGGLSCIVKVRRLRAVCVQYERAPARFSRLIAVCSRKASQKQMITRFDGGRSETLPYALAN